MTTKKSSAVKSGSKKAASAKIPAKKTAAKKTLAKKVPAKTTATAKPLAKKTAAKLGGSQASAKKSGGGGRKYSPDASQNVEREMHEMHEGKLTIGKSHKKVTNPKQAIAIALSEARRSGKKVPPNPNDPKK